MMYPTDHTSHICNFPRPYDKGLLWQVMEHSEVTRVPFQARRWFVHVASACPPAHPLPVGLANTAVRYQASEGVAGSKAQKIFFQENLCYHIPAGRNRLQG
jgi:hypothetical protein